MWTGGTPYRSFVAGRPETYALGFAILRTSKCRRSEGTVEKSTREHIGVRHIGTRELENRVAQHREYRNRDRRSFDRVKKRVNVDLYRVSGI
jgi:hypothetical protein